MAIDREALLFLAKGFGIAPGAHELDLLDSYAQLMLETNKSLNLTAITDERGVTVKHFADSLSVLSAVEIKNGAHVIDVGTGAGFPGIPLIICRPDIDLTLLDSTKKKLGFIENSAEKLGVSVNTLHMRAEECGASPTYRESFDLAVSRAVAYLPTLCEFCLPLVKVGGCFAAMKGAKAQEEIDSAESAIRLLGGKIERIHSFALADDGERNIIIIRKISQTPPKYPRASTVISKKPL